MLKSLNKVLFFFFVIGITSPALPAQGVLDSLKTELDNHTRRDSVRASICLNLSQAYSLRNDRAKEKYAREGLNIFQEVGNVYGQADAYGVLSTFYFQKEDYERAYLTADSAIRNYDGVGNACGEVKYIVLQGKIKSIRGNPVVALVRFRAALRKVDACGESFDIATVNLNIGIIHFQQKDFRKSRGYFRTALRESEAVGEAGWEITSDANTYLGQVAMEFGDLDSALYFLETSLALKQDHEQTKGIVHNKVLLGKVHLLKGNRETSDQLLTEARSLARKRKEPAEVMEAYRYSADWGIEYGRYDSVYVWLEQALEMSAERKAVDQKLNIYLQYVALHKKLEQYKTALEYHEVYADLRDSLFTTSKATEIAELEIEYQTDQREKENTILKEREKVQASKTRQLYGTLIAVGLVLALVVALSVILFNSNARKKRVNEQLESQKKNIETQNRMLENQKEKLTELNREKDHLIGIVAHDLKSPLNKMKALAQLTGMAGELNEEQQELLGKIDLVHDQASSLVRDLVDLYQAESAESNLQLSSFELNGFIRELISNFKQVAADKQISLEAELQPEPIQLTTDRASLTRILDNLISNAIKFSNSDTQVKVRANAHSEGVTLAIQDQGPGISESDRKKLFQKFTKLSARPTAGESSSGLGLSIVKALIERLGGGVSVDSELGEGSTFFVKLPLKARQD